MFLKLKLKILKFCLIVQLKLIRLTNLAYPTKHLTSRLKRKEVEVDNGII